MHIYRARGAFIEWQLANATAPAAPVAQLWSAVSRSDERVRHWWASPTGVASISGAGGIASGEAFGTATVTRTQLGTITGAGGIASGEAFGAATVTSNLPASITDAGGIASGEAFGTATFTVTGFAATITDAGGIASGIAFGTATIDATIVSTLIVEDGTAKADAESYISVADADSYFAKRGMTAWAALELTAKEAALRLATDYMVQTYRTRWAGRRVTTTQALDWPRYEVPMIDGPGSYGSYPNWYDDDVVPQEVRTACAELAYRASAGTLLADLGQLKKSVTVGPITTVYADGSVPVQRYAAVDRLLAPFLKGGGGLSVVRC